MMKYPCCKTFRFSGQTQSDLDKVCRHYRMSESEYICTSVEKCLHADLRGHQKNLAKKGGSLLI